MKIQNFSNLGVRVETGAVQFGDDWPGVFIRGDAAMYYCSTIQAILKNAENNNSIDPLEKLILQDFLDLLSNCHV